MKQLAILVACFPAVAWAHGGHHLFDSVTALMAHLLSEPDHAAMLGAVLLAIGWMVVTVLGRRQGN